MSCKVFLTRYSHMMAPGKLKCPLECPPVAARLQVFTDALILATMPADSPYRAILASEMPSRAERVPCLQALNNVYKRLAEFEPSKMAKSCGIFRARWARLPC
jgi:hypothetical protein